MPETVCIVYNEPVSGAYSRAGEAAAVSGVLDAVRAVRHVLCAQGHAVDLLPVRPPMAGLKQRLQRLRADVVFNLFEGFDNQPESEAVVAAALESAGCCVTGAPAQALRDCQQKHLVKTRLRTQRIATPDWVVATADRLPAWQSYPCIVKPLATHASHGISELSLASDPESLQRQVEHLYALYQQPALIEQFLPGREFNVLVMAPPLRIFPIEEIRFDVPDGSPRLLTFAAKWDTESLYYKGTQPQCPAQIPGRLWQEIETMALSAFQTLIRRGYARFDLRQDSRGDVMMIDVNPNPDIGPTSGARLQAETAGLSYAQLINEIIRVAEAYRVSAPVATLCGP